MKKYLSIYYLQYVFFVVLFFGAIGQSYAIDLGELRSELAAEKGAVEIDVVNSWKKMFDFPNLRTNVGALEALSLPKGSRPNPSTYLDGGYISNHISKFDGGVTKITSSAPTGSIGPPSGTFVLPKSKADDLINQSNGSVNKLEEYLGLNAGDLGSSPVRVDVGSPTGTRMPSGNELGANDNWIPGGKTLGGVDEAVVDQIQSGTYNVSSVF